MKATIPFALLAFFCLRVLPVGLAIVIVVAVAADVAAWFQRF